jgi:5-bromo-4-chloroindolyl phosphate hydrolysis protein
MLGHEVEQDEIVIIAQWENIQGLLKKNGKKLAQSLNFTFRDIDNVLSLTNFRFGDFVDRFYPMNLK